MRFVFIYLSVIILSCTNDKIEYSTYSDYKNDQKLLMSLPLMDTCREKDSIVKQLITQDFVHIRKRVFKECLKTKVSAHSKIVNEQLKNEILDLLRKDQSIRDGFNEIMQSGDFSKQDIANYYYRSVRPVDSLNLKAFDNIVNKLGHWPGSRYYDRLPEEPKIEVLISHFPEKGYVKFFLKAYEAARQNEEYWSRVITLANYSRTRPIEEYYLSKSQVIIPIRFSEIDSVNNNLIDSDLTELEFETISNPTIISVDNHYNNVDIKYQLLSSLEKKEDRLRLLNQARDLLIKKGLDSENVNVDDNKMESYYGYKLYYKILIN